MTKRKLDKVNDSFIQRLKNIFCQLNNLATFMYLRKIALSIESFVKAAQCTIEEIQYLALIVPDLIKLENGFIIMKIKDQKRNASAAMKERIDKFNEQLLLLQHDGLEEELHDRLAKETKSTATALVPFANIKIEMDPPRCLHKCLMNITNASFYKGQMSEVVEEKRLEPVYGMLSFIVI